MAWLSTGYLECVDLNGNLVKSSTNKFIPLVFRWTCEHFKSTHVTHDYLQKYMYTRQRMVLFANRNALVCNQRQYILFLFSEKKNKCHHHEARQATRDVCSTTMTICATRAVCHSMSYAFTSVDQTAWNWFSINLSAVGSTRTDLFQCIMSHVMWRCLWQKPVFPTLSRQTSWHSQTMHDH